MSQSTHQIRVQAKDQTSAAFSSIKSRASATGAQIRSMLGGALAAAGAYLGLRSVSAGIDKLGHLSDIAQKTSTNVSELTKTATAMSVLGIQGMAVDQLAKSFDYMAKTTGRSGMGGFYQTLEEIGKIENTTDRAKKAVEVFGRSGMELMPLINAAKDGTSALRNVIDVMPGVSQAAADAGDKLADAKTIGAEAFQSIWLKAIGAVCGLFHTDVRAGMVSMAAYAEYGAASAWRYIKAFFSANEQGVYRFKEVWRSVCDSVVRSVVIMSATCYEYIKTIPERFIAGVGGGIMSLPAIFSSRYREWHNGIMKEWTSDISNGMWSAIDRDLKELGISIHDSLGHSLKAVFEDVDTSDLDKRLNDVLNKAVDFNKNLNGAVLSTGDRARIDAGGLKGSDAMSLSSPKVRNELILGGNEANRVAMLGPQLQSETKRQTKILEEIRDGISGVEKNTDPKNDEFIEFN